MDATMDIITPEKVQQASEGGMCAAASRVFGLPNHHKLASSLLAPPGSHMVTRWDGAPRYDNGVLLYRRYRETPLGHFTQKPQWNEDQL